MPITTQQISAAISALSDRIGQSLGFGTGKDAQTGRRILYLNGLPFPQYYAQARSELIGYIRGLGDGFEYGKTKAPAFDHDEAMKQKLLLSEQRLQGAQAKLSQADEKLSLAERRLRLFHRRSLAIIQSVAGDIFTDAHECQEAVEDVSKCSADLWALIQSLPKHIREAEEQEAPVKERSFLICPHANCPQCEREHPSAKRESREKELEAIQVVADLTDRTIGADDVQCDRNSEVEFVEGGAWVSVRIFASDAVWQDGNDEEEV